MAAGPELLELSDNLNDTRRNVKQLRLDVRGMEDTVANVRQTLEYAGKIEDDANGFIHDIDAIQTALKVVERIGPLEALSIGLNKVLGKLELVAEAVRDKAHDIDRKVTDSGFYQKVTHVENKLGDFQGTLYGIETDLDDYQDNVDTVADVLRGGGSALDGLSMSIDGSLVPVNDALVAINTTYDAIAADVGAFKATVNTVALEPLSQVARQFEEIAQSLSFLREPLDVAYSKLKPIEPVLDAVGFIYNVTVAPVVNWLLDKLGINAILDSATDSIAGFLPSPSALDGILAHFDAISAQVDDFLGAAGWNTDISGLIDHIRNDFLQALGHRRFGKHSPRWPRRRNHGRPRRL